MPPPSESACWAPAQCQLSVKFNHCQLVSIVSTTSSIKLPVSSKWQKSHLFRVTLQEKWLFGCLWHRSRSWIQELELTTSSLRQNSSWASFSATFSVIALYQSSCLNLHCKLKSASLSWPVFGQDRISRHGLQEATYSLQLALMEWERKARKAQPSR